MLQSLSLQLLQCLKGRLKLHQPQRLLQQPLMLLQPAQQSLLQMLLLSRLRRSLPQTRARRHWTRRWRRKTSRG